MSKMENYKNELNSWIAKFEETQMQMHPNPLRIDSIGVDQEVDSVDSTYTVEELESLWEMKVQLYELECKLNAFEAQSKDGKNIESKINSLKEKINEFSNELGQSSYEK